MRFKSTDIDQAVFSMEVENKEMASVRVFEASIVSMRNIESQTGHVSSREG